MHKYVPLLIVGFVIGGLAAVGAWESTESPVDGFIGFDAPTMSVSEMDETEGALFPRFASLRRRLRRISWKRETSNSSAVHCDFIARNRAEGMGLDTSTPTGGFLDYDRVTVNEIYQQHRSNASPTPPPGTAGYIFTGNDEGKTHLQVYDNRAGGALYDRYINGSYDHLQEMQQWEPERMPPNTTQQAFVPLPRRDHNTILSWE